MALARIGLVGAVVAVALPVSAAGAAEVRLDRIGYGKYGGPPPGYFEELVVRAAPVRPTG